MNNNKILEYVKKENELKQVWLGKNPQFDMDIADIENCTNFRLPPKFHGKYDNVWIFEKPLNEYHILSWKIVLDEAIRLLKENGKLVIRLYETSSFTIPMLKNFLGRRINIQTEVDYEYCENNYFTIVFNIKRLNFEIYQDKTWTLAMLTGGKKDEVVLKFLESIRNNEPQKSQIIISGPKKEIYDRYDVEYLDMSKYRDDEYAEISRKKNDIAKMATGANILIAHDRYCLNDKFFSDFDDYGYDFDFLAMRQFSDADKKDYPCYCYYYGKPLWRTHIGYSSCYSKLLETQYANGGISLFKVKTFLSVKFNSTIFWNQKEDAELSYEMIRNSIVPRVNFLSKIYTNRLSNEYPWDVFDGKNFKYNTPITKRTKPTVCGIDKVKLINLKVYSKSHFPFFGFKLKFFRG